MYTVTLVMDRLSLESFVRLLEAERNYHKFREHNRTEAERMENLLAQIGDVDSILKRDMVSA